MRVTMHHQISGTRNGQPWPARGEDIDLPDDEAQALIAQSAATATTDSATAEVGVGIDIDTATKVQLIAFAGGEEPPIEVDPTAKVADIRAAVADELARRELADDGVTA